MRLLPERHDHGGGGTAEGQSKADRSGYRRRRHQYLSLRHLPAGARSDPCRDERVREAAMNKHVVAPGLDIPFGPEPGRAADGTPEVNAWVVIRPDETVVVRIARSEMGQGTLTGLAQLVAEELECDWSKVTTEYPTPGTNAARNRVWRDYSTGGSRGIRTSHDYVRQGGAAARVMLIQAAADQWKVPAAECTVSK